MVKDSIQQASKKQNICGNCEYMFDEDYKRGMKPKTIGDCDNRFSPCCGQIVFYDTPACDEYKLIT